MTPTRLRLWRSGSGDLRRCAGTVANFLVPGGFLYLAESHSYAEAVRWRDWMYGGANPHLNGSQGDYTHDATVFEHPESWNWRSDGMWEVPGSSLPVSYSIKATKPSGARFDE